MIGLIAMAMLFVGSWVARTHPNSGYDAGYEAATARGAHWLNAEVKSAGGATTAVCEKLHHQIDQSAAEPRYDHATFVRGCTDAFTHLNGTHVPPDPR